MITSTWRKLASLAVAVALIGGGIAATSVAASAATAGHSCNLGAPKIAKDGTFQNWHDAWPSGADWSVQGQGPATLTLSKSVSIANSYTRTLGVSQSSVSATVGFNVIQTHTTQSSYAVKIGKGTTTIEAGHRDAVYYFNVYEKEGVVAVHTGRGGGAQCVWNQKLRYVSTGYVYRYNNLIYRFHKN